MTVSVVQPHHGHMIGIMFRRLATFIGPYVRAHVLGWEEYWSVRARPLIFHLLIGLTLPTLLMIYHRPHSAADDRINCGKLEDGLDIGWCPLRLAAGMGRFIAVELNSNHEPDMAIRPEPLMVDGYSRSIATTGKAWFFRPLTNLLSLATFLLGWSLINFRQTLLLSL